MTQPRGSSFLLPLLCLALGLAGGFGIARSLTFGRAPSELEASGKRQVALTPQENVAMAQPTTPLAPQEETRGEVRVAVAAAELPSGGAQSPPVPREIDPDLEDELTAYLRSGKFEERMIGDGERLQDFLAYEYARSGEAHRALELLESFPTKDYDVYLTVGSRLVSAGDREAASRAYLKALELAPYDEDIIEELKDVDPVGTLAAIEARALGLGSEAPPVLDLQRAQLLATLGRTEEAIAVAQNLLGFNNRDPWAVQLIAELDPAGAERDLRSRLGDDPDGLIATRLAERLIDSEREGEAITLLESALARSPENSEALNRLADLQPEKILSYLDSPAANELDSYALSRAATLLLESGKEADAIDLWVRAVDQDISDDEAVEGLLEHAPERLWEQYRRIAQESTNDEELGDVADMYWRQGRRDEATDLWRRASMLDPADSEWSGNLRSILLGENPL